MLLGRGSNLLIRDDGIRGVVISLAHPNFSNVEVSGNRGFFTRGWGEIESCRRKSARIRLGRVGIF